MPITPERVARYERALDFAERQVQALVERAPDFFPMYTSGGRWRHGGELWTDWCGGFLAGMMWLFDRRGGTTRWRERAEHYSRLLEPRKTDRHVHDLGFLFLNSYRRWHKATGDPTRMDVVAEAGTTLAGRFQEKGQYLASFLGPHSLFIDIMMNVPILFVAADWVEQAQRPLTETTTDGVQVIPPEPAIADLRRIALAHCRTSQRVLVRTDGSTAHEAVFDTATGQHLRESTQQGLRPDSCWSRGLAWALYGFGTVYRLSGEPEFLATARRSADYYLARVPPSGVPFWDFDAPEGPDRLWDSSAAAIAASGLLELAAAGSADPRRTSGDRQRTAPAQPAAAAARERYRAAALDILDTLCSDEFLAASTPGWEGVLRHAVYHFHKRLGVDESVLWGDHFFVEALMKALA